MKFKKLLIVTSLACGIAGFFVGQNADNPNSPLATERELERIDNGVIIYPVPKSIKAFQRALVFEGYDIKIDGILGSETWDAYKEWKDKNYEN